MQSVFTLTLDCYRRDSRTNQLRNVQVNIIRISEDDTLWRRCQCEQLQLRSSIPYTGLNWSGDLQYIDITILQPETML